MSEPKNDGGAAFPRPMSEGVFGLSGAQQGMSLRDYLAAHAPPLTWEWANAHGFQHQFSADAHAAWAYAYADSMLVVRDR